MDINDVTNSFKTFEEMYDCLFDENNTIALKRKIGSNEYPEIKWLIEYFIGKEEYEKCERLKNLRLPKVSNIQIEKEINWLKLNNHGKN